MSAYCYIGDVSKKNERLTCPIMTSHFTTYDSLDMGQLHWEMSIKLQLLKQSVNYSHTLKQQLL